jgi:O-antigen/teichoic acid export membrane protein
MVEAFSTTGIDAALIQRRDEIKKYLDTAWTVSILRSIGLTGLIYLSSPLIAGFFGSPKSEPVLKAISLVFVIRGFTNVNVVYFIKEIDTKRQVALGLSEIIPDVLVSVVIGLLTGSVWALLWGFIAGALARTLTSFIAHSGRPQFAFELPLFKELTLFGRWVWGTNVVLFLSNRLDSVVVGKFLGVSNLGYYQMSLKLTDPISRELGSLVSQVLFPAYSSIQDEVERLKMTYKKTVRVIFSITFPLSLALCLYAPRIVPFVLAEKWYPIVPAVQALALAGFLRSIFATDGWLYYATANPVYALIFSTWRLLVLLILVFPLTLKYGFIGTSVAVAIANAALAVPVLYLTPKIIGINAKEYLGNLLAPFVSGFLIMGVFFLFYQAPSHWPAWVSLGGGLTGYLVMFLYLEKETVFNAVRSVFNKEV